MILDKGSTFITGTLHDNGFQGFIVGGSVRDYLMGKPSEQISDYDIITDATPEAVMKLFPRTIPTGLKHGTVTVLAEDETYEVTTFRTEGEYKDCRHPEEVAFVSDIREDLLRRDANSNLRSETSVSNTLSAPYAFKVCASKIPIGPAPNTATLRPDTSPARLQA